MTGLCRLWVSPSIISHLNFFCNSKTHFALAILGESLLQRLVVDVPVQNLFIVNYVDWHDESVYQDRPPTYNLSSSIGPSGGASRRNPPPLPPRPRKPPPPRYPPPPPRPLRKTSHNNHINIRDLKNELCNPCFQSF